MATGDQHFGYVVSTGTNGATNGDAVGAPIQALGIIGGRTAFTEAANVGAAGSSPISIIGVVNLGATSGTLYQDAAGTTYYVPTGTDLIAGVTNILLGLGVFPELTNVTFTTVFDSTTQTNTLTGTAGADVIYGGTATATGSTTTGTGGDTISAAAGNDTVLGMDGNDVIDGGAGNDHLYAGIGNDTLTGGDGIDTLEGAEGDDILVGGADADLLYGGADTDVLTGGAGADVLDGGAGTDTANYSTSTGAVQVTIPGATGSTVAAGGDAAGDTLTGIENVTGSDIAGAGDSITGSADANVILGLAGNDSLFGGDGADTLIGGAGADLMFGGDGNDVLYVGYGDTALADGGNDLFVYTAPASGAETPETITVVGGANDTTTGSVGDVLDLSADTGWRNTPSTTTAGSGFITLSDGTTITYSGIEQVLCFTPGAMIRTLGGARAIETLKVGDMVLTRDNGMQPIRWIGRTEVAGTGAFAPIRLRKGAVPELTGDLVVSPQHRMLIEGYRAELLFGEREVLASAKHMVDGKFVTVEEAESVTYIHMLFDRHEVVYANGAATESYHPASYGLGGVCEAAREEMFAIFPELRALPEAYGDTARRVLKAYEVNALAW